jgi:hypothetical protein
VARLQVVEVRELTSQDRVLPLVRFVLMPTQEVRMIELHPESMAMIEELIEEGIPGPDGTLLFPRDGLAFMQRLPYILHATYLWATDVFEMDAAEALAGGAQ